MVQEALLHQILPTLNIVFNFFYNTMQDVYAEPPLTTIGPGTITVAGHKCDVLAVIVRGGAPAVL